MDAILRFVNRETLLDFVVTSYTEVISSDPEAVEFFKLKLSQEIERFRSADQLGYDFLNWEVIDIGLLFEYINDKQKRLSTDEVVGRY